MNTSNYTIKVGFGKYTYLDRAYISLIRNQIYDNESWTARWEVYDMVVKEIIRLQDEEIFEEIKYRVTGGEDINQILLNIMGNELESTNFINSLISKVKEFTDIDWLKDFYE